MKHKKVWLIILGICIILLDQITKVILIGKNITVIPNVLNFTYTENTGVAFGIGSNNLLFIIIVNIIVLGMIIKFIKEREEQVNFSILISLILILSGGIGNLIDRIVRGYVIDFIDVHLPIVNYRWPAFNFADCGITVGVFIYIIMVILEERGKSSSKK